MIFNLIKKTLIFFFSVVLASLVIFVIIDFLPGDTAQFILGIEASTETLKSLRQELKLDLEWYQRYFFWLKGLLQGDLGSSYILNMENNLLFTERLKITVPLIFFSIFISLVLAYIISLLVVYFQQSWVDWGLLGLMQLAVALPSFWVAFFLIIIFSVQLNWLPAGNFDGWNFSSWSAFFHSFSYLLLPIIALCLPQTAIFTRIIRNSLLEAQEEDFIKTAKSKGLSKIKVLYFHVLPFSQIPIITIVSLQIPFLITGTILIEHVFYLPGMGNLILQAIYQRDLIIVRNAVLLILLLVFFMNFLSQLIILFLNPDSKNPTNPLL